MLDASTAAVHTGFGLSRLAPGGSVPAHVHSYEESLYVLDGRVVVQTPGEAARLGPGDYGLIPVGVPHSLRNDGDDETRFARLSAPLPRPAHDLDTQLVPELAETDAGPGRRTRPADPPLRPHRGREHGPDACRPRTGSRCRPACARPCWSTAGSA